MAQQTILVTGAAGFVGSRLAKALLERGERVIGLDNLNDYYPLEHKRRNLADLETNPQFTFTKMDLRDAEGVAELIRRHPPDAVAHLGAMAAVRYSVEHPLIYVEVNVRGTMNLLEGARKLGRTGGARSLRFVLASTGSVYGRDTPVPFRESSAADRPLAPYPASKRAMELFAHSYHHLFALPITVVRFFNVYGPHGRPDMMPWQWTRQILAGEPLTLYNAGRLQRDWTYIDDIVAGFIAALDNPLGFEILNLGCSRPVENIEFVRALERLLGRDARIVDTPTPPSEPLVTHADITHARERIGYDPKINIEEGLKRFVDWARAEGVIQHMD